MVKYQPFRFWCQKVLPLVYDDSLSYYELLCKVVGYLNNLITDTNQLITEYEELKNMIDNMDLQDEVNTRLDEMAEDGTLDAIVSRVTDDKFQQLRRKLLPITGSLRELMNADRTVFTRISRIEVIKDEEGNITRKRVYFRRGEATCIVSFNEESTGTLGLIASIRGYSLAISRLYGTIANNENQECRFYFNGMPGTFDDLRVNDEFTDLIIYKKQDTDKYIIHHFAADGVHIYYNYPGAFSSVEAIPRIYPFTEGTFTEVLHESGLSFLTTPAGNAIVSVGSATWTPGQWYELKIIL